MKICFRQNQNLSCRATLSESLLAKLIPCIHQRHFISIWQTDARNRKCQAQSTRLRTVSGNERTLTLEKKKIVQCFQTRNSYTVLSEWLISDMRDNTMRFHHDEKNSLYCHDAAVSFGEVSWKYLSWNLSGLVNFTWLNQRGPILSEFKEKEEIRGILLVRRIYAHYAGIFDLDDRKHLHVFFISQETCMLPMLQHDGG